MNIWKVLKDVSKTSGLVLFSIHYHNGEFFFFTPNYLEFNISLKIKFHVENLEFTYLPVENFVILNFIA